MGKYEKKKHSDFHDIQNVFAKRDKNRAARQDGQRPQDYPEVPEFMNEPRRIRGDAGYSMDDMREVHEGRAVYESSDIRGRRARAAAFSSSCSSS